jgi:hypothetical protein
MTVIVQVPVNAHVVREILVWRLDLPPRTLVRQSPYYLLCRHCGQRYIDHFAHLTNHLQKHHGIDILTALDAVATGKHLMDTTPSEPDDLTRRAREIEWAVAGAMTAAIAWGQGRVARL